MAVTSFGRMRVGATVPGLSAAFESIGSALTDLDVAATAALAAIATARSTIDAQITAIGAAKIAIRIPAATDLDAQLTAALNIAAGLSLQATDPAAYLAGLTAGVAQVQARLGVLVPSVALSVQATAQAGIAARLEAKIGAIDLELEALDEISAALTVILTALGDVQAELAAVLQAAIEPLAAYAEIGAHLEAEGAYAFMFEGNPVDIGAELDVAIAATPELAAAGTIRVPIVAVSAANAQASGGIDAVFRTS